MVFDLITGDGGLSCCTTVGALVQIAVELGATVFTFDFSNNVFFRSIHWLDVDIGRGSQNSFVSRTAAA